MKARVIYVVFSFLFSLIANAQLIINEIHYNPDVKTEQVEFIELYNKSTNTVNIGGWYFSDGVQYTFPSGTTIAPRGYVVIAQNPTALKTKYGYSGAYGPYAGGLSKYGEKVTLRNSSGYIINEVDYKCGFPWPIVGDPPGYSIELIHPDLDNNLGSSWRISVSSTNAPSTQTVLIQTNSIWKFFRGTNEPSSQTGQWRSINFNDSVWESGATPIGYDTALQMATPLNDMNSNYTTIYLRKTFVLSDPYSISTLYVDALYDDGFKVWINGFNVLNANIATTELPFNGTALSDRESAVYSTFVIQSASSYLISGTNIIAIQVANSTLMNNPDCYIDVRLRSQSGISTTGPTPGKINTAYSTNAAPNIRQVSNTPQQPSSAVPVLITAKVTDPDGVNSVFLEYQIVNPGNYIDILDSAYTNSANWIKVSMNDEGRDGDITAGDDVYSVTIPSTVQQHRRLIRYRITVADRFGISARVPYPEDPQPNFAYFVYNNVPSWIGAVQPGGSGTNATVINVPAEEMGRLPTYHLISKKSSVEIATGWQMIGTSGGISNRYTGDVYFWPGTLVYDGKVYDHIHFRARGGVWRYAMVKNMWKFDMNRGHDFEARDNWGKKFDTPWNKLNLGASIQQGDYNHRGEQGMFESVGFRLFQLAGVPSVNTTFVTFRVIDEADEASPTTQYEGDFWGLYLATEQPNGRFLEEHNLP
ncbi:MAG TPA: lamin tail domain-containing protein, partial [Verrucomicrobiota bacterium]|nr:lamin tail domain-containing protein [Verrucomicrobiota bacterium]